MPGIYAVFRQKNAKSQVLSCGLAPFFPIKLIMSDYCSNQYLHRMLMQIFFSCRQTTSNVAFGLVHVKHFSGLRRKGRVDLGETFCDILMYGRNKLERYIHPHNHCLIQKLLHPRFPYRYRSIPFHPDPVLRTNADRFQHFLPYLLLFFV